MREQPSSLEENREPALFRNQFGKENPVRLSKRREQLTESVGFGAFGTVHEVDAKFPGEDEPRKCVLKIFRSEADAARALENYAAAKRANLKAWKYYLLSEDGESILMPSANQEGWRLVDAENTLPSEDREAIFNAFEDMDLNTFLDEYYSEAEKASLSNIVIGGDAPFFIVKDKKIGFLIGDLDQVSVSPESSPQTTLKESLQNMHSRLVVLLEELFGNPDSWINDEGNAGEAEKYIKISEKYIKETFGVEVSRYSPSKQSA